MKKQTLNTLILSQLIILSPCLAGATPVSLPFKVKNETTTMVHLNQVVFATEQMDFPTMAQIDSPLTFKLNPDDTSEYNLVNHDDAEDAMTAVTMTYSFGATDTTCAFDFTADHDGNLLSYHANVDYDDHGGNVICNAKKENGVVIFTVSQTELSRVQHIAVNPSNDQIIPTVTINNGLAKKLQSIDFGYYDAAPLNNEPTETIVDANASKTYKIEPIVPDSGFPFTFSTTLYFDNICNYCFISAQFDDSGHLSGYDIEPNGDMDCDPHPSQDGAHLTVNLRHI